MTDLARTRVAETLARQPTSASASRAAPLSPRGTAGVDPILAAAVPGTTFAGASRVMPDATQSTVLERDCGESCAIQAPAAATAKTPASGSDGKPAVTAPALPAGTAENRSPSRTRNLADLGVRRVAASASGSVCSTPPVRQVASTSLLGACGPECIVGTAACEPARRGTVKAVSGRLSEAERELRADLADAARCGGWDTED